MVYDTDFTYASDPAHATKVTITLSSGDTRDVTAQGLLNQASHRLLKIAEP